MLIISTLFIDVLYQNDCDKSRMYLNITVVVQVSGRVKVEHDGIVEVAVVDYARGCGA